MASDLRYMKLGRGPGSTWFFVYSIPQPLRGLPRFTTGRGKPMTKITESLGTTDPETARQRRNERLIYWDRQFRMLQHGPKAKRTSARRRSRSTERRSRKGPRWMQ